MSFAFLVMAARAPLGLEQLVRAFDLPGCRFFVHLDCKTDAAPFEAALRQPHVSLIGTRHPVYWGGFNMVLAELDLVRAALADPATQRLILLSDDSFPLANPSRILEALAVDSLRMGHYQSDHLRWRYDGFYFFDSEATVPQHREPAQRCFGAGEIAAIAAMGALHRKGKAQVSPLLHGPQWWSITRDAASCLIAAHESDPWRAESFRFSCIPDEHYVQTILGTASPGFRLEECPVWFDFSRDPKPYVFRSLAELQPAFESQCLFVRKVAQDPSFLAELAASVRERI